MNITIYMAVSADGFIATQENTTPWSDAEWENYNKYLGDRCGLIVGRKTYEEMDRTNEFEKLNNPDFIVVSDSFSDRSVSTAPSPDDALSLAKGKNWKNVIVGGGKILNSYFLKNKMASHLHLDIEPVIFGNGLTLFENLETPVNLKFLSSETLDSGTISIDYEIEYKEGN